MALPTPTALTATKRYIPAGRRRIVFVPTIATKTAPSSAEITAGTELTGEVAAIAGFDTTAAMVEAKDFLSRYAAQVAGMITSSASSITLYCSNDSVDARSLLVRDLAGFIVIFPEGIVTATKCNVYPVTIMSSTIEEVAPDAVATQLVTFAITSLPAENVTTPTA